MVFILIEYFLIRVKYPHIRSIIKVFLIKI